MSKKDKQNIKRRQRESAQALNNVLDIGDIGEFDELTDLSSKFNEQYKGGADVKPSKKSSVDSAAGASSALQLAINAFADSRGSKNGSKKPQLNDDVEDVFADTARKEKKQKIAKPTFVPDDVDDNGGDDQDGYDDDFSAGDDYDGGMDDEFDRMLAEGDQGGGRKRRRAPDMEDFGGDDQLLEEFDSKKKEFAQKKKEFYTAAPRYGGREESIAEGQKRAVTYEIVANKGLMPHRKKANRNPRVKKREMYAKALVARKGQVREVVKGAAGAYGGELTGIKANVARSRKLTT
jgi:hypothetical protein